MADQDEIDDWLDSDSDDDAGGDAGVALGTPNDSFVADLMTPGTTPESLRKTDAKTEPAPAPAPVPENTSASTVEPEPAREDLAPAPEEARPAAEGTASPVPPPLAFDPPSPAPVAVTIPDHDGVELAEDEMQTLALSPGASTAPPSAFAPADLRDGPSIIQPPRATATMNAEIETAEEDDERGDEDDADGFDEGDSYGSGAYGDDLGDDDVLDKIGEWGERLTKFTNEGLSRVRRTGENIARSDYAAKAIEAAKGVGKELAELGSHIAGDDLTPGETDRHEGRRTVTRNSANAAGGDAPDAGELDAGASLWGTFAGFAKKAADAIETAAAKAADAIEKPPADETPDKGGLRKLASRSTELVSNLASRLEAGAFELLGAHPALSGDFRDDAAAEIEAALDELGLRERVDAMETAADEGMAACEAIRSALASDEDRVAFDDAVFVAREILDLHDGTLHDGTPKAPSAPSETKTETDGASHPLITEASALREGGVDELLEIAGDVASALERRAADAVAAVRGAEGADAVVSAATRLRLLDEADELVAEMRGECARRVAAFALVVVSHLRTAQSGEGFVGGENLGSSVAARAGETRAAVDGALRELEGYAKDAAEAMRAATADVDAALGAPTEPSDGSSGSSGSAPPVASVGAAAAEACAGTWVPIARDVVADAAQCVVFPLVAASRSGGTEAAAAGGGE